MNRGQNNESFKTAGSSIAERPVAVELNIPSVDALEIVGALQSTLLSVESRDYTLDIEQTTGLTAIGNALLDGKTKGYIEMATGTGKTAIEAIVVEATVKAGKRVLVLAPKITIADQISGVNQDGTSGLAKFTPLHESASIGHHYGNSRANRDNEVVVSTYQGFLNDSKQGSAKLGDFDVVIADECHRGLGQKTAEAMRTIFPDAIKLGFSATPDYATDRKSEEVFDQRIFEFSLIDAIESGKTAPIRTLAFETEQVLSLFDDRSDFTERELAPLIENIERNGTAIKLATAFAKEGRQGIIACIPGGNNLHARLMAEILSKEDSSIRAAEIGAHLSNEQNALRLQAFQEGSLQVLTFTRALEEGWDSNKASFCINMAPTSSPVRTKQLLGRVLRRKENEIESIYVDFIDDKQGSEKTQYTALHALDLSTVETDRVLGRYTNSGSTWHQVPLALPSLDSDLMNRLIQSNGRLLSDLSISKRLTDENPLVRKWENIMKLEGMPAELPANDAFTPEVAKAYDAAYADLIRRDGGLEPNPDEVIEMIKERTPLTKYQQRLLGEFGIKLTQDPSELQEISLGVDNLAEANAYHSLLKNDIHKILQSLSEREAKAISMRFGLYDDKPKSLDEIGDVLGFSKERVRQIESKALGRLRTPGRSKRIQRFDITDATAQRELLEVPPKEVLESPTTSTEYEKHLDTHSILKSDNEEVDLGAAWDKHRYDSLGKNSTETPYFFYSKIEPYLNLFDLPKWMVMNGYIPEEIIRVRADFIHERVDSYEKRIQSLSNSPASNQEQRTKRIELHHNKIIKLKQQLDTLYEVAEALNDFYVRSNKPKSWVTLVPLERPLD